MRLSKAFKQLKAAQSGVAMTEFALSLPLLMVAGLYGAETANLALTNMRVSQAAMQIADNASRIGDTSTLQDRKIYESDINDLLLGSNIQLGDQIDLYSHGRVIISSLEIFDPSVHCTVSGCGSLTPDEGEQFIHWQRCKGMKGHESSYGVEGQEMPDGMGPLDAQVNTMPGEAVIFVEITYDYKPLIGSQFTTVDTLSATASFIVRDDRDLSQIYQRDPVKPDATADCQVFDGYDVIIG